MTNITNITLFGVYKDDFNINTKRTITIIGNVDEPISFSCYSEGTTSIRVPDVILSKPAVSGNTRTYTFPNRVKQDSDAEINTENVIFILKGDMSSPIFDNTISAVFTNLTDVIQMSWG